MACMAKASTDVLQTLSTRGYRITDARKAVVDALARAKHPVTIQELAARVRADEVSVYRTIALLKDEELLEELFFGEELRYALFHEHHHHVVCRRCNYVVHIPCNDARRRQVNHPVFSEIDEHELTFYGTCKKCA